MPDSSVALSSSLGTLRGQDEAPTPSMSSQQCAQKFIGAVKDEWHLYSDQACDYTMGEPIGFGASSTVYTALWKPVDDPHARAVPCALKVLDLDSLPPRSLSLLQRETTLMSLSKHPNVLRVRGSWMEGHKLYIALRLMNKGSAADVMRYGWPGGMEEEVVKCILRQALKGLGYLHVNGFIHRDIKAANMLIDDDGTVLLGDLGVAADLSEDPHHHHSSTSTSKHSKVTAAAAVAQPGRVYTTATTSKPDPPRPVIGKRKSFVGTPCWMAPELISGKQYDASADIWSFGITALELSQGHPPRFRESPQKVLLRTLQEEPPSLDRQGGAFKYSKSFKEMVDSCLVKDPSRRPTAEQLLNAPFFRTAKKKSYLVNAILKDLPPLVQRQERRALPHPASPNSIDSWDFATTVNSPVASIFRHSTLERLVAEEEESGTSVRWERKSERPGLHEPPLSVEHPEFEFGTDNEDEIEDDDDRKSNDASSTTASETLSSGESSTSEPPDGGISTAPSSYVVSSPISITGKRPFIVPGESHSTSTPPSASETEHLLSQSTPSPHDTVTSREGKRLSQRSTKPALTVAFAPSAPLTEVQSAASESDVRNGSVKQQDSSKRTGLWRKLTNNLKSSKGDGPSEKSKLGELFSSASKGTIGKARSDVGET